MKSVLFMEESALVIASKPYLWIFTSFAIMMPPCLIIFPNGPTYHRCLIYLIYLFFAIYIFGQLLASIWFTYINSKAISEYVNLNSADGITCILSVGINVVQLIVQIGVYVQALIGNNCLRKIFITIVHLEWDIRQHCMKTSMSKEWQSSAIRWRLCLRVGLWLNVSITFVAYLCYELSNSSLTSFERVMTVLFGTIIQVKGVEYCLYVQLVQELLCLVQQQLLHLRRELVHCECLDLRTMLYAQLRTNQQLLARVWNLLNQVERYFCIPMLMMFFYNGFSITQAIHWAYINFELDNFNLRLCRIIYTVMVIVTLFVPCYLSQCCIDEYNQFGTMLHKLKVDGIDGTLSMRLQEYSLQLMHQKMLFTCGGFFDVNLKNFGAIILTITTYVVILIQFKLQAETEKKSPSAVRFE